MSLNEPVLVSGNITSNFTIKELANSSAREKIKLVFNPYMLVHIQMMQELRDLYKKPIVVSSWYRTPSFNRGVGGTTNSEHLIGCATDVLVKNRLDFSILMDYWKRLCNKYNRVGNIGIYSWGLHLGSRGDRYGYKSTHVFNGRK